MGMFMKFPLLHSKLLVTTNHKNVAYGTVHLSKSVKLDKNCYSIL